MSGPIRVLHVVPSLGPGGAERSLVEQLAVTDRAAVVASVAVFEQREGFGGELETTGVPVVVLEGRSPWGRARALRRLVARFRPDVVHTTLHDAHLVGRLALLGRRRPRLLNSYVNTTYEPIRVDEDPNVSLWRLRGHQAVDGVTLHLRTDHVHAISHTVAQAVEARLRWPARRTTVISRARDTARLGAPSPERTARTREQLGMAAAHPLLVTVGRLEYQKGLQHLVRALPGLADDHPGLHLLVAGREGNASAALRALVAHLGLADRVTFLGFVPDVADLIAAADVFVFPSVWEGLGGAVLEAMGIGVPIVASDIPALRELCGDDAARLVPPRDPEALARGIRAVLADPAAAGRRIAAGRHRVALHHDLAAIEAATRRLYEDLAGGSLPRRAARRHRS